MANCEWYYAGGGNQVIGPIRETDIRALMTSGTIAPDTFVWTAGMRDWVRVRDVPGLWGVVPPPGPGGPDEAAVGPQTPRVSGLAIASLVLGLMPCSCIPPLLAIVLGHLALHEISRNPGVYEGRGLALCGTILGYVFTILYLALGVGLAAFGAAS